MQIPGFSLGVGNSSRIGWPPYSLLPRNHAPMLQLSPQFYTRRITCVSQIVDDQSKRIKPKNWFMNDLALGAWPSPINS